MRIIKHIVVTFSVALITIFGVLGGYSLFAQEAEDDQYYSFIDMLANDWALFAIKLEYHDSMNSYFNDKLAKLVGLIDSGKYLVEGKKLHKDFVAPEDVVSDVEKSPYVTHRICKGGSDSKYCSGISKCKDNVSTYCTALGAMDIYLNYVEVLNSLAGRLPASSEVSGEQSPTLKGYLEALEYRETGIDEEVEDAKKVLDAAIGAFDEFKLAYPQHKKYEDIISNLIRYRSALKDIRQEATFFPVRFVDASSSECQ